MSFQSIPQLINNKMHCGLRPVESTVDIQLKFLKLNSDKNIYNIEFILIEKLFWIGNSMSPRKEFGLLGLSPPSLSFPCLSPSLKPQGNSLFSLGLIYQKASFYLLWPHQGCCYLPSSNGTSPSSCYYSACSWWGYCQAQGRKTSFDPSSSSLLHSYCWSQGLHWQGWLGTLLHHCTRGFLRR